MCFIYCHQTFHFLPLSICALFTATIISTFYPYTKLRVASEYSGLVASLRSSTNDNFRCLILCHRLAPLKMKKMGNQLIEESWWQSNCGCICWRVFTFFPVPESGNLLGKWGGARLARRSRAGSSWSGTSWLFSLGGLLFRFCSNAVKKAVIFFPSIICVVVSERREMCRVGIRSIKGPSSRE